METCNGDIERNEMVIFHRSKYVFSSRLSVRCTFCHRAIKSWRRSPILFLCCVSLFMHFDSQEKTKALMESKLQVSDKGDLLDFSLDGGLSTQG